MPLRTVGFRGMVNALRAIPPGEFTDDRVLDVLRGTQVAPSALAPFLQWDPERYTRHLVYREELFQILVLCWNPGQATPVHDHADQKCWMAIERGRLEIADFAWNRRAPLDELAREVVGDGELHVDQCACLHKIDNCPRWDEPAVSIHVYSRPFDSCHVYDPETGRRERIELSYDSVGPLVEDGV